MAKILDPTRTRLSDSFLLSDFMGCTSVYRKGYPNHFEDDEAKLRQGMHLAETLEAISRLSGSPLSIVYGFISPSLSWEIVRYQDPDKPSYHRWDAGAAADFCAHNHVNTDEDDLSNAPITLAWEIDSIIPYSRMITYSESPIVCFATNRDEKRPRQAFYENKYTGILGEKPYYNRIPAGEKRQKERQKLLKQGLEYGWKGHGFPTYHLRGVRGYEHYRVSKYTLLSDYLYCNEYVYKGTPNMPRMDRELRRVFRKIGPYIDVLVESLNGKRVSIIRGLHNSWHTVGVNLVISLPQSEKSNMDGYSDLLTGLGCQTKLTKEFMQICFPPELIEG